MEPLEAFMEGCTLDEEQKAPGKTHTMEKKSETRQLREKRDLADREKRRKAAREKKKECNVKKHQARVAVLSKMSLEERKEFIRKEKAEAAELDVKNALRCENRKT